MTIRTDATKRISGIRIALAFGLAPMMLPALARKWRRKVGPPVAERGCMFRYPRRPRKLHAALASMVGLVFMAGQAATSAQACDISPPARATLTLGEFHSGGVVGSSRAVVPGSALFSQSRRTIVYQSEPITESETELFIEKLSGGNEGRITVCAYDTSQNWDTTRHLGNYSIDRGADPGAFIRASYEGLEGRRLLVEVTTLRRYAHRSFGFRMRIGSPGAATLADADGDIAEHQHIFELEDEETGGSGSDGGSAMTSDPGPSSPPGETEALDDGGTISDKPWVADPDVAGISPGSKLLDALEQAGFADHPQMQPLFPLTQPELFFGPEQADPDGYFTAPTTAPVGSSIPIRLTYDDRRYFDNLILVKADAPDSAVGRSVGRNTHLVGDEDLVHRRAGDTPGVYEVRLRRHHNFDRRIMARKRIEVTDIDIDLQMREVVTAGEDFDVLMSPVMDGHLYVTTPDRDPENLISRNAQRRLAIEAAEGPGLFTRRAPRTAGEYELRFNFNPSPRWSDVMGREGRLMARFPFEVVDAPAADEAVADEAEETEKLEELEAKITALSEDLEQVTIAQTEEVRDAIAALGLPALAMLVAMLDRNDIAPELTFAITAPVPPAQWGVAPAATAPVAPATPVAPMAQPQPAQPAPAAGGAIASTPQPAGALSPQDERRVIMLVARLEGASQDEQDAIAAELAQFGPAATDLLLEMMQEGLVDRATALGVAAAIEAGDSAAAPTQPSGDAAQQQDAAAPPGYQVVGVAPNDMLNVRDRAGVSGSNVIGQLAPDARDVMRTGDVQDVGGRDWWHVSHPTLPPQGGWVNSRFLSAQAGLAPQELAYRVTGVAADDRLNIRDNPGIDGEIVGRVAPDAAGLRWTGESAAVSDATWWELAHPDLPNGAGWVNSRFLEAQAGVAVADAVPPALSAVAVAFTEAEGYEPGDPSQALSRLLDTMPQTSSIFPPGGNLGPLTKAVLLLENEEGVADHARYRIRYGMERRSGPPGSAGAQPLPFSFVQVDRFNLGEVFREAIAESFGEARTPPPEAFGAGEHVSYRFEFRPIQGRSADPIAMSRQVIPDGEAQGMDCLTLRCLHLGSVGEGAIPWQAHAASGTDFDRPYEDTRNGVYTPATMTDLLAIETGAAELSDERLRWTGYEGPESVRGSEPFVEIVMDVNLAQDFGIEAVLHEGHVMDDSISAVWKRAVTFPGGDDTPQFSTQRAFECARGEPNHEGLCP
ncbi:MAG: SH3 domain-containing protein [Salinarimonadaceae bacterium]|nr:MAG: SH3 domain-containing protein [Salinarimonadaceae bacterium]